MDFMGDNLNHGRKTRILNVWAAAVAIILGLKPIHQSRVYEKLLHHKACADCVELVLASPLRAQSELSKKAFPKFDRPTNTTSGLPSAGSAFKLE